MDKAVSKRVFKNILMTEEDRDRTQAPAFSALTPREQEIARLIAERFSKKDCG